MKQRAFMDSKNTKHTQNDALDSPSETPAAKLGKTFLGPTLSGAVARARMVEIDPITWAASRVNAIWNRVSVFIKIIPKPACPECVSHGKTRISSWYGSKLTDTLNSIENTKPEPENPAYKSTS